jgi:hypothetical protein
MLNWLAREIMSPRNSRARRSVLEHIQEYIEETSGQKAIPVTSLTPGSPKRDRGAHP